MEYERAVDPGLDPTLHSLSQYQRRFVLEYLDDQDGVAQVGEVAAALASREGDAPELTERIATALRHVHLPALAANGFVTVDGDAVTLADEEAVSLLACLGEYAPRIESSTTPTDAARADTYATYCPLQHDSLSDAILDAIVEHRGEDLLRTDFGVFEDVHVDVLDRLLRTDARAGTRVTFTTGAVRVELWGDDGVKIRVSDAAPN